MNDISPIETLVAELLSSIMISSKPQFQIRDTSGKLLYVLDFAVFRNGKRYCIECDGWNYHHRTPEQEHYDSIRDKYLQKYGWRIVRLSRHAICFQYIEVRNQLRELFFIPVRRTEVKISKWKLNELDRSSTSNLIARISNVTRH